MYDNEYFPRTLDGYEMRQQGVDPKLIEKMERDRLALQSLEGEAGLIARHPDAARPEVRQRINAIMAADVNRYITIAESASPVDAFEAAYGRAMDPTQPAPAGGAPSAGMVGGLARPDAERRKEIQQFVQQTGNWVEGARQLGGGRLVDHPDLDVNPRR